LGNHDRDYIRHDGFIVKGSIGHVGGKGAEIAYCEIIGQYVDTADNHDGIRIEHADGAWIHHNIIHGVQGKSGNRVGIKVYKSRNLVVEDNYTGRPQYTFGAYSQGRRQTFDLDEMRSRGFEQHSQVVADAGEIFQDEQRWELLPRWRTAGRDGEAVGPENVALVLNLTRYGPAGRTATAPAADVKVHRGLAYAKLEDPQQMLDVYAPTEGQRHPVVLWIHGGGWHRGDKADVDQKPQAFVDQGFVFISVNYRLFPSATIKQIAEDVAKAIRWIHDHARDYRGDPDSIIVTGHSAGAQLAALVCTDDGYLKAEGLTLSAIKACVPVDGDSYDVPLQIHTVEEEHAASYTLTFGDERMHNRLPTVTVVAKGKRAASYRVKFGGEAMQRELSAVTHVAKGKNIPPFLILYVRDHLETKAQSQRLVQVLQAAGISARAYPAEGKNHTTINTDLGLADDRTTQEMFEFLNAVLTVRTHLP